MKRRNSRKYVAAAIILAVFSLGILFLPPPLFQFDYNPVSPQPVAAARLLRLDLNTADETALCSLPGMGGQKAKAILQYRRFYGGFVSVEELRRVDGVSDRDIDCWKEYLYI